MPWQGTGLAVSTPGVSLDKAGISDVQLSFKKFAWGRFP